MVELGGANGGGSWLDSNPIYRLSRLGMDLSLQMSEPLLPTATRMRHAFQDGAVTNCATTQLDQSLSDMGTRGT